MNDEVEWLNTLEMNSCRLVTSADDLRSGVVLCDLVAYLKSRNFFEDVQRHGSVQKNFKRAAINNFKIFIREIGARLPSSLLRTPEELFEDVEILLEIVKYLKKLITKPLNTERVSRNLTPRVRVSASPALTSRLQHSPSMLDIHIAHNSSQSQSHDKLKTWLQELKLIKFDVIEEMKDGVVLCELINRLEGRNEVIKGMHKAPKTKSAVQVNINKALNYLRGIEKLNSKYLWSANEVIQGDEETVFGLLQSIQDFYSIKRSASASRSAKVLTNRVFSNISFEAKADNELASDRPEPVSARAWIQNVGLGRYLLSDKKHFLDDPCRNGLLLAEVLAKLEGLEVPGIFNPKSAVSASSNYEKCLKFIYERHPSVAVRYLREIERFLESDALLWLMIEELISIPRNVAKPNTELPYSREDLTRLETSLLQWLGGLVGRSFDSFEEILSEISTLLAAIVQKCGFPVTGITKTPKTGKVKQGNIEKSLECLRRISRMSQKFLFKGEELAKGNFLVALGLLEDVHRFYDGLPARKRGPHYHSDGPYLGKKTRVSPLRNISSLLNKSYESPKTCCSSKRVREDFIPRQKFLNFDHVHSSNEFDWVFSLGLTINSLDLMAEEIEEFSSGVLLCQIIDKLERKEVTGFQVKPKGNAGFLFNVGKALKVLKEKPNFPSSLMFVEDDIVKGKGDAIRDMLRAVFKIYRQAIKTQIKFYNPDKVNLTFV